MNHLLWLTCLVATFTLVHNLHLDGQSPADRPVKLDSDLVFDNLDQNHDNHRRIGGTAREVSLDSSPPVEEEHWLSSTVNRIKRSINRLLSSKDEKSHKRAQPDTLKRVNRQEQQTGAEYDDDDEEGDADLDEDEDYDDEHVDEADFDDDEQDLVDPVDQQEEDNDDDLEDDEDENQVDDGFDSVTQKDVYDDVETPETPEDVHIVTTEKDSTPTTNWDFATLPPISAGDNTDNDLDAFNSNLPNINRRINDSRIGNSDDEDLEADHSGSGDVEDENHAIPPIHPIPGSTHPVYFRISFTVGEPYTTEFQDRNSYRYRDFTQDLVEDIEALYQNVPGKQSATVIQIEKRESDTFTSKVTVDLGSEDYNNHEVIRSTLYDEIVANHRLGTVTVIPDDFQFRAFEARPQVCLNNEIPCQNGQCVPATARCNGTPECSDGTDEAGCFETPIEPEAVTPFIGGSGDGEATPRPPNSCRADDDVRCDDGSRSICSDQVCDGKRDCDDGGDEKNCPSDCNEGEFMCDIRRCIPISKICDGVKDCVDETDEGECGAVCRSGEISCDNRCVPEQKRCDGTRDCNSGIDEQNCPSESQCRQDEFHCGDGQCIHGRRRCDGVPDCRNDQDELNCPTAGCRADEFKCRNGQCVPNALRCNRKYDCQDNSDEVDCPCNPTDFHCKNGFCIPHEQKCDGIHNCQDSSDEEGCPPNIGGGRCTFNQWQCQDGSCIPRVLRCNAQIDCNDGSDEHACSFCESDQFRCNNGTCISLSKRCNGVSDCLDHEDEDPPCALCKIHEFKCHSGECVDEQKRCNKYPDCPDGSDEIDCNGKLLNCVPNAWMCHDDLICISKSRVCDGYPDCEDESDENFCSQNLVDKGTVPEDNSCAVNQFRCAAGFCIMGYKKCNGIVDCPSGNDEENCPLPTPPPASDSRCPGNKVPCPDNQNICAGICNGVIECEDYSDESDCRITCNPNEFTCRSGACISGHKRCDGRFDCDGDGSDEENCPFQPCPVNKMRCPNNGTYCATKCNGVVECEDASDESGCRITCNPSEFTCRSGACISGHKRCDGRLDCDGDGSDEDNCGCTADQFDCGNAICIDHHFVCDGVADCLNNKDEQDCNPRCTDDEIECTTTGRCISKDLECNRVDDCGDGTDELDCELDLCTDNEFQCSDRSCIPNFQKCNGSPECLDGSDEIGCRTCHEPDWFQCVDGGGCIDAALRCDNFYDCRDFSDEQNCLAVRCRPDQYQCLNGQCVDGNARCNRRNDCSDGSDEYNCLPPPTSTPGPSPPGPGCPYGYVSCRDGQSCIARSQLCDGKVDCLDMSDETTNCDSPTDGACTHQQFRCENGPCIAKELQCDGKVDCPRDSSDELDCEPSSTFGPITGRTSLDLKTYPSIQDIKENQEVVFECRDEGLQRARVRWTRPNGLPLPPGSRDNQRGRLEMPNIKVEHAGTYICEAVGYPSSTPGAQVTVQLNVERWAPPPPPSGPTVCISGNATCANGECIPKERVCDGRYDCSDGSDETRCNPHGCEPNEFRCANKKCILKIWRCDSDDDCGDHSDEDNCVANPPGSLCQYHQFACHSKNQCIPRAYHCDLERDCVDGSDEIGCSKPVIMKPPPPMVNLAIGSIFEITCTAVGVPTPEISWRLNWGHIPPKCNSISTNGVSTLTCPNIQIEDQGAYSCEAINIKGTVFAVPDTILVVEGDRSVCPAGYFNEEARSQTECIKCFCFGQSSKCRSADLFIYQFQPPFDTVFTLVSVDVNPSNGVVTVSDRPSYYGGSGPQLSGIGRNGLHAQLPPHVDVSQGSSLPYFAMPENYHRNQLKSYGGYLRFTVRHSNNGYPVPGPTVILSGNGYTLQHQHQQNPQPYREENVAVRFFAGEWVKKTDGYPGETPASREEIMMTLADIDNILIKLQYNSGPLNTTITNIEMDSAATPNSGLGAASYVEECECPVGYEGTSCERCAPGYVRHKSGPWLGKCYRDVPEICPPGTYGDPARGRPCEICPCPLTSPSNQFARTCSLGPDGEAVCDCPPGYVGRRCEQCAPNYVGNPTIPGDSCRFYGHNSTYCNRDGSISSPGDGQRQCQCKDLVDGIYCDQCKPNTFHLSGDNQFGCVACFCMGVTTQCSESNWFRDQIGVAFTTSRNDFKLIDNESRHRPIESGINLDQNQREISYSSFSSPNVHYWSLPPRFLGNKITSYGGHLRYTLRYVPLPGGQSSRNSAADVEIISSNKINLLYFSREQVPPTGTAQTFSVPLLEQYWQRADGQQADREHLLMALADLESIYIKATYNTNTRETALISVSLDVANERNTGSSERASAVEQCHCPVGYKGTSCEDCDVGYTRDDNGIYLGVCKPCSCNGNSNECDPESGICFNCNNFTTGENCDQCLPGYEGDPANGIPCRYTTGPYPVPCSCDPRGSVSSECYNGQCQCKTNVVGPSCNRCRQGTFGLNSTSSPEGCLSCFCSGVTTECSESNLFIEQIPSIVSNNDRHGFTLTDQSQSQRIDTGFLINIGSNEIGYNFRPSTSERWYWSLPLHLTGNQIKSYGGKLEFTQRYTQRPRSRYIPDRDVIIRGNGLNLFWSNPQELPSDISNKVSVVLSPQANWQRLDQGPRPASREDILTVLANVESILIRAQQSSDTESAFLSDITLDTAVDQYAGFPRATDVEMCRCPPGYRGTSCESCSSGHYRDTHDYRSGPLGSCSRCPCNNNEQSCSLGPDNRVACNCLPGYSGRNCERNDVMIEITPPVVKGTVGTNIQFLCKYKVMHTIEDDLYVRMIERGMTVYNEYWYNLDSKEVSHVSTIGCYPSIIKCEVKNSRNHTLAEVEAEIRPEATPGTTPNPYTTAPPPAPTIEVVIHAPAIGIYEIGSTVRFNCTARPLRGNPPVRIYWSKDGSILPQNAIDDGSGRLVITGVSISDSGRYICQAYDGISIETKDIVLHVGGGGAQTPRVVINPPFVDVQEGQLIEVMCAAEGNPQPDLRFHRIDGQPLNPDHYFENGIFRIGRAEPADSGRYQCIGTNSAGTHTAEVQVSVRPSPSNITHVEISPPSYIGRTRDTITLRCIAPRNANSIRWTRREGPLPFNSREIDGVLTIYEARASDSGTYICSVSLYTGQTGSAAAEVRVSGSDTVAIAPTASVTPERITIAQGSSAELHCEASGSPPPTIKWTRVNSELPDDHIEQVGRVLRIRNAQISDRGIYVCVATNQQGLAQASTIVEVNRLEVPRVSIHPDSTITVTAGNSAMVECRIESGSPTPIVIWSRPNGAPLGANVERMSGGVLRFMRIADSDGGEYVCSAENEAGQSTAIVNIVVHTPPEVWTIPGENVVARAIGERVRLECHGTGTPLPSVEWIKYGSQLRTDLGIDAGHALSSRYVAIHDIARFSAADTGYYICRGRSDAGVVEKRIQLTVRRGDGGDDQIEDGYRDNENGYPPPGPPRPIDPSGERLTAPVGTNAELRCRINDLNNNPIYIQWARADNRSLPENAEVRGGILYISNAQPDAAGEYRCIGSDKSTGRTVFSLMVHLDVISPPSIMLTPQRQVVHPGNNAYIQCSATGQQPIRISWTPMGRDLPPSVTIRDGLIEFRNIQMSDAGRYRCTARNSAGEADAVADVVVEADVHKPTVTADSHQQSAPVGSSVTLRCRTHNTNNINNIRWFRQNLPLPPNSRVQGEYLNIFNLRPEDQGRYYCEIPAEGGTSSDFIDLDISHDKSYCSENELHCENHRCIPRSRHCDGYDDCEDGSDEKDCTRIRRGPDLVQVDQPTLHITPEEGTHRAGENIEVNCQSNEPGVITTWTKLYGRLGENVRSMSGTLRIDNVRSDNSGTYRCEATGHQGVYHKDYNLNVIDDLKDEQAPLETKTATQGSGVIMECKTNLPEPITFTWTKQGGKLPDYVDIFGRSIQLNNVGSADAGTYICSARNAQGQGSIEIPMVLIVTGIVPYFAQAPSSYIELENLPDPYLQNQFEISFKPQNGDALILYTGNKAEDRLGSFLSLSLKGGVPEFRYNLRDNTTVVRANSAISLDQWHTIKVARYRKKATMYVDGEGPFIGNSEGRHFGLTLREPLYLGGVPDFNSISPEADVHNGFVGCISRLKIGHSHKDIMKEARLKQGITTCETCSENRCENQGVCQEAMSPEGYTCICPAGFSGHTCSKLKGEACSPYACGIGRCIDTEQGFECLCPLGRVGQRCEREVTIVEPAFKDDAFIAYSTPKLLRALKVTLKAKVNDLNDGILMYCGETDEGHGDFASLAIKDRHLEFRFDVGNGPTIIRSNKEVVPGEWMVVTASRRSNEGRLVISGDTSVGRSPNNHKALNLLTPLYIGGVDKQNVKVNQGVGVDSGFNGCISDINFSGLDLKVVESVMDSANVDECSNDVDNEVSLTEFAHENVPSVPTYNPAQTGCSSNPCKNRGECYPLNPVEYKCSCVNGFAGRDCEIEPRICETQRPCQNGGSCTDLQGRYECSCTKDYTGINCEQKNTLRSDATFNGRGYLEFSSNLLDHSDEEREEVIAIELSTNSSDGLIFWQGQSPNEDGQGQDFIALSISGGYLEFSYDLGSGPVVIRNDEVRVDNGHRHSVVLKRHGKEGSVEIDNSFYKSEEASGITTTMNTNGNIYLGGVPDFKLMTGGRFTHGFVGCILGFELQDSRGLDLGSKSISGVDVKSCSSSEQGLDQGNDLWDDNDLVN